jgi:aryl-alcohol dehydrogenase-like predicted oxidoreductase
MRYKNLGRSGLLVSRLALGTMNFGPQTDEAEAHRILDCALESGINLIDTADIYGWRTGEGITERIIGNWLAGDPGRRERIVLATKVYGPMGPDVNAARLSALHIRRACEASLRRLQTDHLDLFQMHHVDLNTPWEEIWQAMELLVTQGKVIYVGASNFGGWHLAQAQERAAARARLGLVSMQSCYNLLERRVEIEVLPAARAYGLGLLAYSPLAGGLLAGTADPGVAGSGRRADPATVQARARHQNTLAAFETWCRDFGHPPAAIALGWLLAQPGVTAAVLGPRTVSQLEAAIRALEVQLSRAELTALDNLSPSPGAAPDAYLR